MLNFERTTSWQQIQQGVKEIEQLLGRNEYNFAMVKARQVLECMVRCMAEGACLVEGDLSDTINQLFENGVISRDTKDNYHTIRRIGNKAVHEGNDEAYDADKAYKLLVEEVYTFSRGIQGGSSSPGRTGRSGSSYRSAPASASKAGRRSSSVRTSSGHRSSGGRGASGARKGGARSGGGHSRGGSSGQGGKGEKKSRSLLPPFYVMRFLIPVLVVVVLVVIIKVLMPGKEKEPAPATAPVMPAVTTAVPEPAPTLPPVPPTEPEPEPGVLLYRIKGEGINVRSAPSADPGSTVLVQLPNGTEVEYVKRYNDEWAVINYDGKEAYVANRFLERIDPGAEVQSSQEGESNSQE